MPTLGQKYTCYSCHTKFYDLGKPEPLCPKCGADQREADEKPLYTSPRSRRAVVEEPPVDDEFEAEETTRPDVPEDEEEIIPGRDEEPEEVEEEDEEL
jgi:hypothetical protein